MASDEWSTDDLPTDRGILGPSLTIIGLMIIGLAAWMSDNHEGFKTSNAPTLAVSQKG